MKTAELIDGHVYELEYARYGVYTGKVEKVKQNGYSSDRYVRHPVFQAIYMKDADPQDWDWIIEEGGTPWKRGDLQEPSVVTPTNVIRHFADSVEATLAVWNAQEHQRAVFVSKSQEKMDLLEEATRRRWRQNGRYFIMDVHMDDVENFIAGLKEIHHDAD